MMLEVTGFDLALCPVCKVGTLIVIGHLSAFHFASWRAHTSPPAPADSS
jgi:hypothetical protein